MANAWEVKPSTDDGLIDKEHDVWRNGRIYRYEEADQADAIEVARRRSQEGDTLKVDGKSFVKRDRKWVKA